MTRGDHAAFLAVLIQCRRGLAEMSDFPGDWPAHRRILRHAWADFRARRGPMGPCPGDQEAGENPAPIRGGAYFHHMIPAAT